MEKHLTELKDAVAELAPFNDPTTRAIKAIAALVLQSAPPAQAPQPPAAPDAKKP